MRGSHDLRRIEARRRHAQRTEDVGLRVLIQRHAADLLHQLAQHDEANVAVEEGRAGRIHQLRRIGAAVAFLQCRSTAAFRSRSAGRPE